MKEKPFNDFEYDQDGEMIVYQQVMNSYYNGAAELTSEKKENEQNNEQ
ncbi:hypothetical protein ACJ2A9_13190 [Anaerobacillus sp. MEB173]